jgi:hypothetical protein
VSDLISVVGWTDNSGNEFNVQMIENKFGKDFKGLVLVS